MGWCSPTSEVAGWPAAAGQCRPATAHRHQGTGCLRQVSASTCGRSTSTSRCVRLRGGEENRTPVQGFAGPCLNHSATPPGGSSYPWPVWPRPGRGRPDAVTDTRPAVLLDVDGTLVDANYLHTVS